MKEIRTSSRCQRGREAGRERKKDHRPNEHGSVGLRSSLGRACSPTCFLVPLSPFPCQAIPGKGQVRHSQIPGFHMIKTPRERGQALGSFLFCPFVRATSPISKDFQQHQEPDTLPILVLTDFSKAGQSKAGTDDEAGNQGGLGNKEAPRIWLA